jgi:methanogenic corrinoid protein MtbC1
MQELENDVHIFQAALLSLDRVTARQVTVERQDGLEPLRVAEAIVAPALERIGEGWERGEIALSQVYMAGRISEELVDGLLPPSEHTRKHQPRMAIGVLEDYHLLGKRLVYAILRAAGYELADYGHGLSAAEMAQRALREDIEVLLISTLMLRSALRVSDVRALLEEADSPMRIVVGGAPFRFDDGLWKEVGAYAMGSDASQALEIISRMEGGG